MIVEVLYNNFGIRKRKRDAGRATVIQKPVHTVVVVKHTLLQVPKNK